MWAYIFSSLIGILCIILGILNMRGNISFVHSYHTHRIAEEDKIPFGRKIGLGTILIGIGILINSVLSIVSFYTENDLFVVIGCVILGVFIAAGTLLCLYAIKKYNKGLF